MFAFNVSYSDPTGTVDGNSAALIQADIDGALRWLGRYIQGLGSLEVTTTTAAQGSSSFLAESGPDAYGTIGRLSTGGLLMEPGPAYELSTSRDPNGTRTDFHVTI